jgi:chromosome partitioning protein
MKTVVLASRKGGAGKTTLAAHLAIAAAQRGLTAALIDADEQGSLAAWWNARDPEMAATPLFVAAQLQAVRDAAKELRAHKTDVLFVDTPPGGGAESAAVLNAVLPLADLVLVPMRPSPLDLRAVGATLELAASAKKRLAFVLNATNPRARVVLQALQALRECGAGSVAPITVANRVDYAAAMTDGRVASEVGNRRAAEEIGALLEYVLTQVRA